MRPGITTRSLALRALFATALVAGAGCGGGSSTGGTGGTSSTTSSSSGSTTTSSSGSTSTSTGSSSSSSGSGPIACTGQPANLSLTGTWAALAELSVKLQGSPGGAISICPADQVGQASLLLLVTIQQNATDATKLDMVGATLCSVTLPTVTALVGNCNPTAKNLVSTQISTPMALINALPAVATATTTGVLGATTPGASITVNALDVTVGSSKSGTNLPAWNTTDPTCNMQNLGMTKTCSTMCVSDCASLRDDDMDSYPGVTVDVCGFTSSDTQSGVKCNATSPNTPGATLQGQAYIDIEVNPSATGTVKSSCEIAGTVSTEILYHLVGAQVYLTGQPITVSAAIESLPTFAVDPTASKIRMVRIDGQYGAPNWSVDPTKAGAACATLNARVNQL